MGAPLTISSGSLGLASGDFSVVEADLSDTLGAVLTSPTTLGLACAALPASSLANKIAVISRGTCTFSTKIRNAQTAGAIAAVSVNNVAGDPVAMASDGTANPPTIPAYVASLAKRDALIAANGKVTSHTNGTTVLSNVNIIGAGRENLASAVNAKVALDPVSLSFGSTPSGSGQTLTKTIALSNLGATGPITVAVTNQTGNGVAFSASYANGTITVTMTAAEGIAAGNRQGVLRVTAGGTEVAHAAVYALIK